ncbi:MAG: MFS transporter [Geodermatophilaceae bacterium]|nr:MFS transporter [Geodermatophilaceae bacterium]
MSMLAVLRRPRLGRLTAAGMLSEVGDWLLMIALPLFVLDLTGSALVTATVFALELVPTVLVGPIAGVLVDRYERWALMSVVATAQALCLLPLFAVQSAQDLWIVYVVVVVESVLGTIIEPARNAAATVLVPTSDLMAMNGLLGTTSSIARLVGGPLGGLIFGLAGLEGVITADAATFVVTALLLAAWPARRAAGTEAASVGSSAAPPAGAVSLGVVRGWLDGLRLVARSPMLRRLMGVVGCMALAQGAFAVLFVLFVVRDLGGSASDVGILRGVQAIGAIAAGALLGLLIKRMTATRLLAVSLAAFGVLSLVTWNLPLLSTAFGLYVGLFIAVGFPGLASMTGLMTLLQSHSADSNRGRILSTFFAVYGGVQALGMLLAGTVGTGAGLTVTLQVQGVLYLVAAGLALRLRQAGEPAGQSPTSAALPEVILSSSE